MQLHRVYPQPDSSAGAWWVQTSRYRFLLLQSQQGWQLSCLSQGMSLLIKYGLVRKTFPTRRDAMHCLAGMLIIQED